ncbi:hypothetical protein AAG906_021071 [Vitis piasezkii]
MEGCYWRSEFPILWRVLNPMRSFSADELQKLQTVTIMRIEFLDTRPISDGIKVVLKGKTQVENEVACGTLGYLGPGDDQKEDYPMSPIQSYVRNHGINGIVDPKILAEGGGVNSKQYSNLVSSVVE